MISLTKKKKKHFIDISLTDSEKNIGFQTNMAARVLHAAIVQLFHYRIENTPLKTSKWREKVLKGGKR